MADIKKVRSGLPNVLQTQTFTGADAVQGDILLIKESLGHPAKNTSIEAFYHDLKVKFNVYHTVFPPRVKNEGGMMNTDIYPYTNSGHRYTDTTNVGYVDLHSGERREFNSFPIQDIELVVVSGDFVIFCS